MSAEIPEVLEFLKDWRTRKEVTEKFKLSNTQSQHLMEWLKKAKLVQYCKGNYNNKSTNKTYLYKTI